MIQQQDSLVGLAYDIAKIISGGTTTDDSPYSIRQILDWIKTTYADWLTMELDNAANNGEDVDSQLLRRHECVAVQELPHGECPCDSKGDKVFVVNLPRVATLNGKPIIRFVGAKGFSNSFREATSATVADIANMKSRFAQPTPAWFLSGQRLYIVTPAGMGNLKAISISYLPEDPTLPIPSGLMPKPLRMNVFKLRNPYPQKAVSYIRNKVVAKEGFWTKSTEPTRDETNNANPR